MTQSTWVQVSYNWASQQHGLTQVVLKLIFVCLSFISNLVLWGVLCVCRQVVDGFSSFLPSPVPIIIFLSWFNSDLPPYLVLIFSCPPSRNSNTTVEFPLLGCQQSQSLIIVGNSDKYIYRFYLICFKFPLIPYIWRYRPIYEMNMWQILWLS